MIIELFGFGLIAVLIVLSIIDLRTMILPDILTLPLIICGLLFSYWQQTLFAGVVGAIIGYLGMVGIELYYKKLRGIDGLGRGDAKLLAAGGAWCGWYGIAFILLIASASGLAHALLLTRQSKLSKDRLYMKLPFGPHLALGIALTWLSLFILS